MENPQQLAQTFSELTLPLENSDLEIQAQFKAKLHAYQLKVKVCQSLFENFICLIRLLWIY